MPPKRRSDIGRLSRKTFNSAKNRMNQSDDQRASRNELIRQQMSRSRMMQTQEERAARNTADRLRMRRYRKAKQNLTNRLRRQADVQNRYDPEILRSLVSGTESDSTHFLREIQKHNGCFQMTSFGATHIIRDNFMSSFKNATNELSTGISVSKPNGIDEDVNESCTWSSFGPSEGSFSVTTTEGGYSISTTDEPSNQHKPEETILVKNEPSDSSLSYVVSSNLSFVIQEVFEDNKDFASIKDEPVYKEYKPSTSHQGLEEKNIKTDNCISDTGVGHEYVVCGEIKTETNVVIEPVLQDIIIKEEVDL